MSKDTVQPGSLAAASTYYAGFRNILWKCGNNDVSILYSTDNRRHCFNSDSYCRLGFWVW